MTTFVHSFSSRHLLCVDHENYPTVLDLKQAIFQYETVPYDSCFFICNGSLVANDEPVRPNVVYHTYLRLPGGKGGFGSMLRAIGAQIEKTTNHEACRDLSGRRMRDVNNEKDLKDWLGKQAEREREKEQRRQERIARRRAMPNHKFEDPTYDQQKHLLSQNQEDAIMKGLQKAGSKSTASATVTSEAVVGDKRKIETDTTSTTAKKRKGTEWLGVGLDDISDFDSDEDSGAMTAGARALPGTDTDSDSIHSSEGAYRLQTDLPGIKPGTSQAEDCPGTSQTYDIPMASHQEEFSGSSSSESTGPSDHSEPKCNKTDESKDFSKAELPQTEEQKAESEQGNIKASGEADNCGDRDGRYGDTSAENQEKPFSLDEVTSVTELVELGLDRLKSELMSRGLKCGGTLEQRAERLFSVRGLTPDQIDPTLFAKSNGKNVKKKK